jgi:hypothetical protein
MESDSPSSLFFETGDEERGLLFAITGIFSSNVNVTCVPVFKRGECNNTFTIQNFLASLETGKNKILIPS